MRFSSISQTNLAICKALGIDQSRATKVEIEFNGAMPPQVRVTYINIIDSKLVETLQHYTLVPKDDGTPSGVTVHIEGSGPEVAIS